MVEKISVPDGTMIEAWASMKSFRPKGAPPPANVMVEKISVPEVKIVLGEIEGKNRAIHAYDGIVWKICSGFLTLLFGGWSILLTGIVQTMDKSPADYQPLAWRLFLFSLGFAFGARYVDRNYIRRKFRVVLAPFGSSEIGSCAGEYRKLAAEGCRGQI
jgi:hypothetical protein